MSSSDRRAEVTTELKRPPSVTVIGWLIVAGSALALVWSPPTTRPGLIEARPVVAIRRVASVILLALGAFYAPVAFMLSAVFLSAGLFDLQVVGLLAIALAVVAVLILAGVALWGWDRWRIVLGVELTVAGGFSALVAGALPLMMRSPQWQAAEAPDEAFVYRMVLGYAVAALLLAGAGIPLIIAQRRRDRGAG